MIRLIIRLYILVLILDAIISYFPNLKYNKIAIKIKQLADFTLAPIRRVLPDDLPFDLSPVVAIIILNLIMALW